MKGTWGEGDTYLVSSQLLRSSSLQPRSSHFTDTSRPPGHHARDPPTDSSMASGYQYPVSPCRYIYQHGLCSHQEHCSVRYGTLQEQDPIATQDAAPRLRLPGYQHHALLIPRSTKSRVSSLSNGPITPGYMSCTQGQMPEIWWSQHCFQMPPAIRLLDYLLTPYLVCSSGSSGSSSSSSRLVLHEEGNGPYLA